MAQLIGGTLGIVIVVIVIAIAVILRLYMMKSGSMHAKCPKCGEVFDASRSFSGLHFGPIKQLKCPACGKISLMNTYSKEPITWPLEEKTLAQQKENPLSSEELERKRIEDSKYQRQ